MRDRSRRSPVAEARSGQPVRTTDVPLAARRSPRPPRQPERACVCGRSFQVGDRGSRCGMCRGGMGWLEVLEFVGPAGKAGA